MTESPRIDHPGPGGFLPPRSSLPSPAPSTASSRVAALLPHPRSKPLVPGSRKEDYAREYVAKRLMHISRRYVKHFGIPDPADQVTGYESMAEVCRDLEEVVDVLWFSGTPSLQVPYLLNIALAFNTYLPSFPPAPRPTFNFLRKLDHCFASLLVGYDVKTKAPLPGFSSTVDNRTKLRFSETERVRCKSLAEETRLLVAEVMSGEDDVVDYDENEYVPQRSTRARTEARSDSVEAADSTSQSFQGVETIKAEEIEEEDYDFDSDSSSEDDTAMNSTKRKAGDMAGGGAMSDEPAEKRRVKVEEDEDSTIIYLKDLAPACKGPDSPTTKPPKSGDKGQFHWALDEDDDEDDEDQPNANGTNVSKEALPSPQPPGFDPTGGAGDNEARGGDGELYEDDEEEEELQMNVGKVYEKTLAHLGQTLGESLTGD